MKKYIARAFEETFPLLVFFKNKNNILKNLSNGEHVAHESEPYAALDVDCLNKRIAEEHERAVKIDEKTSKFTLGLSVSLTVLAAASGVFAKLIPASPYAGIISIACGVASIYMLLAGITALGALKTLAVYGYGTQHLLKQKSDGVSYLSQALYAQERMNIVRQLRNEAAYQSLRNGFIVLLLALFVSVAALTNQQTDSVPETNKSALSEREDERKDIDDSASVGSKEDDNKSIQPTANASAD